VAEVRAAGPGDVSAIHRFGEAHVGAHYAPLIGTCTPSSDRPKLSDPCGNVKSGGPLGGPPVGRAKIRQRLFYEREGFAVDRIEPSSTGDPALAVLWRVKPLITT
jgi:hypothetical protein